MSQSGCVLDVEMMELIGSYLFIFVSYKPFFFFFKDFVNFIFHINSAVKT